VHNCFDSPLKIVLGKDIAEYFHGVLTNKLYGFYIRRINMLPGFIMWLLGVPLVVVVLLLLFGVI
jgi:hypothetical protein